MSIPFPDKKNQKFYRKGLNIRSPGPLQPLYYVKPQNDATPINALPRRKFWLRLRNSCISNVPKSADNTCSLLFAISLRLTTSESVRQIGSLAKLLTLRHLTSTVTVVHCVTRCRRRAIKAPT